MFLFCSAFRPKPKKNDLKHIKGLERKVIRLERQGRYAETIVLAKKVLAVREKFLGPDYPDVAESLDILGRNYQAMGDLVQAESLFSKSLAVRKKALAAGHT